MTLGLLMLCACAGARLPRVPGEPPPVVADAKAEEQYQGVLDRFTRSQAVYDNLDSRMFFRATVQTPTFVEARIRREATFKAFGESEVQRRLIDEAKLHESTAEIFLAVHSNDPKHDDFNRSNSMWRIALVIDGVEHVPTKIERVGRVTTEVRSYYSYMESFWVGYKLSFDGVKIPEDRGYQLKLASAVGQALLEY